MRINFEVMAAYMLPHCPVAAKHGKKNALGAKISSTAGAVLTGKKGKSGVTLCYHEPKLFHKLPKDQKAELSEWTKNNRPNGGNKRKSGPPGKKLSQLCRMSACRFCCPNSDILCRVGDMSPTCFCHVGDTTRCRVGQGVQNDTTCRLFPTCRLNVVVLCHAIQLKHTQFVLYSLVKY
jgi:hypothetical protein